MKELREFLNEGKLSTHDEVESFLKTVFKKVGKTTNSGIANFLVNNPKSDISWDGELKIVVGRDGLSTIDEEAYEGEEFTTKELFKEIREIAQ